MTYTRVLLWGVLLTVLAASALGGQAGPDCEEWNTKEYFQTATVEDVTACLDAGADPKVRDYDGDTPLNKAAGYNENPAVSEVLLAAGAKLEARASLQNTPLHWAAGNKNSAVVQVLLAAGAELEVRNEDGFTPLHRAAMNKNLAVIQALIDAGADLKVRDKWGFTPLHRAARYNENSAVLEILLAAGAELKVRDKWGNTLLHRAARYNENSAVLEILLAAGAELEVRDKDGNTPLHWAAAKYNENPAVVQVLLAAGAELEVRDKDGNTPLHRAADQNENSAVVQVLLAAGAELEVRDKDGNTPLHRAAKYVHFDFPDNVKYLGDDDPHAGGAIEALLDAGADPMAPNAAGETPWDLAKANKALKGSDAYWRLNEARFEAPGGGAHRSPTKGQAPTSDKGNVELAAAVPSSGPGCMIAGYPSPPGGVANLGFSWCPASVTLQVRSFALQAAGAQCAIATGSSSTPEQINARRQEIKAACDRLAALGAPNCQCPPGLRP